MCVVCGEGVETEGGVSVHCDFWFGAQRSGLRDSMGRAGRFAM